MSQLDALEADLRATAGMLNNQDALLLIACVRAADKEVACARELLFGTAPHVVPLEHAIETYDAARQELEK